MATVPLLVATVSHLVVTVPPLVAAVSPLVITLSFCSMTSALGGYGLVVPDEKKKKTELGSLCRARTTRNIECLEARD